MSDRVAAPGSALGRSSDRIALTAVLATTTGLLLIVESVPAVSVAGRAAFLPLGFVADDSLFYLQIARHIARGDGSTFNALVPTNGYHPLWMLPLVALASVLGDRTTLMRATLAVGAALLGATALVATSILRRRGAVPLAPLATVILATGLGATVDWVSEAHLAALLLTALVGRALGARPSSSPAREGVVDGLLAAGCVLARLDTVGFALAGGVLIALASRSRVRAAAGVAAASAAVLPYLLWNLHRFGHATTISAALQFHAASPRFDLAKLAPSGLAALGAALATGAAVARFERDPVVRRCGLAFAGSAVAHAVAVAVFHRAVAYPWYWVQSVVAAGVFAPLALHGLVSGVGGERRSALLVRGAAVVMAVMIPLGVAASRRARWSDGSRFLRVPFAVESALPPRAAVFVDDSPGAVAWFTELRVVAADGLTADWAYQDSVHRLGASCALARMGVGYVLHVDDGRGAHFTSLPRAWPARYGTRNLRVSSALHRSRSDVALAQRDELLRLDVGLPNADRVVLWRLAAPPCVDGAGSTRR